MEIYYSLGTNALKERQRCVKNLNSTVSTLVKTGFYFSFTWAGWIFHFYTLFHTILQSNKRLWKAYCVGGYSSEQNRRDRHRHRADQGHPGGRRPWSLAGAGCLLNGVGGGGSPLTLPPPCSYLSRATQSPAKERENEVNPKTDKKTLKCYCQSSPWFKTKL